MQQFLKALQSNIEAENQCWPRSSTGICRTIYLFLD